jgi:AcrR family transcriptional regulator
LTAAKDLFDERGFQRTTTRDIGERAGLDPTLISR